ncbi:MAG: hypothetical protein HQL93_06860 [Magnetococcales bacterium]|nr:hypothetical protein [Magnetococcales bacterium]
MPSDEPNKSINLAQLIDKVLKNLQSEQKIVAHFNRDDVFDLEVFGNACTLEKGLNDLFYLAWQSIKTTDTILNIQGTRLKKSEMLEVLMQSYWRPLVWLPSDCNEVVEISLPIVEEIMPASEQNHRDVSFLCVPTEDGNPGICLLPVIVRQHAGALLVKRMQGSLLKFCLWLPLAKTPVNGLMQTTEDH